MALFLAFLTAVALTAAPATAAPQLSLENRAVSGAMPVVNGAYQTPRDGGQVFYIQRSSNANTVVYATKVSGGQIDPKTPVSAYWRRYNTSGEAKALGSMERSMAYGVSSKANGDGTYNVSFKALPSKVMTLKVVDGRPALFSRMGDTDARLVYAYLDVDESGLLPKVTRLKLIGRAPSGKYVMETYKVNG
ncbi:DUF4833 domain-containing protein [Oceanicola sp. 22II-s10i]|uniref:DUF4833 domain-containing protein n=1 Tax=Oceanicola sp. 22II-s10i TaxID=1317116 RepID=UPI001595D913|nr:DUF4833 domain-containing protein [Oceanicola sp. 22II-s10i]